MDDALFWADPAQLRIIDEVAPSFAPVRDERFESAAFDAIREMGDGCADDLVAATDGEGLYMSEEGITDD
jgi:hypothetical protein